MPSATSISQGFPLTKLPLGQPFHFGGEVPQFPSLPNGPSLQPFEIEKIDKSDESVIEEGVKIASEDEGLKGDYSLSTNVKSSSRNCKRVSPPHCAFEISPSWRSCWKLILRSIPSFSTLTPEKKGRVGEKARVKT